MTNFLSAEHRSRSEAPTNPTTNTLTRVMPLAGIIDAARYSVGFVRFPPSTIRAETNRGQTCALVRFDRNSSGERFHCLLSRTPDMDSWSSTQTGTEPVAHPTPNQQATGPGPPPGPEGPIPITAHPPTSEMSGLSLARDPVIALDQEPISSGVEALSTRPPGHLSPDYVLARDPTLALLADAHFEFACGVSFRGLEVKFLWRHPQGGVLLELAPACVASLERMGLAFLPLWYTHIVLYFYLRAVLF